MEDDIAAVASAFGDTAVFSSPLPTTRCSSRANDACPSDDDLRAHIDSLDARFKGALSFGDVFENRQ